MARTTQNFDENKEEEDTSIIWGEAEHPPIAEKADHRTKENSDDIDFFWNKFGIESKTMYQQGAKNT